MLSCSWRLHWWRRPWGRAFEMTICELKRRALGHTSIQARAPGQVLLLVFYFHLVCRLARRQGDVVRGGDAFEMTVQAPAPAWPPSLCPHARTHARPQPPTFPFTHVPPPSPFRALQVDWDKCALNCGKDTSIGQGAGQRVQGGRHTQGQFNIIFILL